MNNLDGRARAAREAYATLSQWAASARAAACGASKDADVRLELGIDEAGLVAALNTIGECPAVAGIGPNILPLMRQFREDARAAQLVAWTRPVAPPTHVVSRARAASITFAGHGGAPPRTSSGVCWKPAGPFASTFNADMKRPNTTSSA